MAKLKETASLPGAVQRQLDEADQILKDMRGGEPDNTDTPDGEVPVAVVEPAVVAEPVVTEETWQHKFTSLKGKYDAEVPRLHADLRLMRDEISQLRNSRVDPPKPIEAPAQPSLVTDKDKEAFGTDLIDLIDRATEQKTVPLKAENERLTRELNQVKGNVGSVEQRQVVSDKDRFLMSLDGKISDWRVTNTDEKFLSWLMEVDPVYGLPRQAALETAYNNLDVERTANIFRAFKPDAPAAPRPNGKEELERQVTPRRTRQTTTPQVAGDKKFYTQGEIGNFYDQWRKGFFTDDEAKQLESAIEAAVAEGRVR